MHTALELAARGRRSVSPNPMVGAVLVKGNRVVGRGYHRKFGGPHAEVEAIRSAGRAAAGSTMYVTMEPCCFLGKTPACTDAIRGARIRAVVIATRDPNPRVRGKGALRLRRAGIDVRTGPLSREARRLNEAYFCHHQKGRPFFTLKAALTLDGMLADAGGESKWITGPVARRRAMELRCDADAVLVGVNTVLRDDPRLTCRVRSGRRALRVVLDSRLRTPPGARLFKSPGPVLVLAATTDGRRAARLRRAGAEVVRVSGRAGGRLSWDGIARVLHRREILSVLIEGGARVASSVLDAGIVDRVCVIHAPRILGPGRNLSEGMRPRRLGAMLSLRDVRHTILGPDVMTEGYPAQKGRI